MKQILLTQGKCAIIDDDDFELVNQYKWCYLGHGGGYAVRRSEISKKPILLHRFILRLLPKDGIVVDHINGDPLDNRKCNLRVCNKSQNAANSKVPNNSSSGYKGVHWFKRDKNWQSQIKYHQKRYHLGYFDSPEDAARAYDKAALQFFGEFARTNF